MPKQVNIYVIMLIDYPRIFSHTESDNMMIIIIIIYNLMTSDIETGTKYSRSSGLVLFTVLKKI